MLVLPGSADNIGGQAFTFKPRWTKENTPESMLVEPPFVTKNGTWERTGAWRHIKHACGGEPLHPTLRRTYEADDIVQKTRLESTVKREWTRRTTSERHTTMVND